EPGRIASCPRTDIEDCARRCRKQMQDCAVCVCGRDGFVSFEQVLCLVGITFGAARNRRTHVGSSSWLMHRSRQRRVAKIERGALDDGSAVVDDQAKSPMFREKGQAMPAQIRVSPAFGEASDLAGLHLLAELRQRQAEAFGNHRCLDLNNAIADLNRFHGRYYTLTPGLARL